MNQNIENIIREVENNSLQPVGDFVTKLFTRTFLPSHDEKHHKRTWNIAKEILFQLNENDIPLNQEIISGLFFSTMFHDTGMTITFDESHGEESVRIYDEYVNKVTGIKQPNDQEIRNAIRYHDKKNADQYKEIQSGKLPDLNTLTSIADDLEAYGAIGIYRYTEIYLIRKTPLSQLDQKVLYNAGNRFQNLKKVTKKLPQFIDRWEPRYMDLKTFFELYSYQLQKTHEPLEEVMTGPVGVVNYIRHFTIENSIEPIKFAEKIKRKKTDIFTSAFFHKFQKELNETN